MEEFETVADTEQETLEKDTAWIENKKADLAPELIDLMPTDLTEDQQVEWLEKAEAVNLPKTEGTEREQVNQIGSYTQQLAREQAEEEKSLAMTVPEQINQHFKALKIKY